MPQMYSNLIQLYNQSTNLVHEGNYNFANDAAQHPGAFRQTPDE